MNACLYQRMILCCGTSRVSTRFLLAFVFCLLDIISHRIDSYYIPPVKSKQAECPVGIAIWYYQAHLISESPVSRDFSAQLSSVQFSSVLNSR